MGGFATTLLTLSLAMMNFRGVSVQTFFIANLCFVACVGLLISAQWAMVQGDTFTYTVLTAFGKTAYYMHAINTDCEQWLIQHVCRPLLRRLWNHPHAVAPRC